MYSITKKELSYFCSVSMHFSRFNDTSHSSMIHFTHELLSQTLEEKPHIYVRPSIILYISPIENKNFHFRRDQ